MPRLSSALRVVGFLVLLGGLGSLLGAAGVYWYLNPNLPSIEVLKDVKLQVPLRVYARDGTLIAEFGEKRRSPVQLAEVPGNMINAVLASEDDRFYEHPGVDWQGITRAVVHLLRTGEKGPGGSTITMQVARNFFLSREKTYVRKLNEILLALKIERELSKDEILELYLNKIFLGNRAYGVGAAAQVYYGKSLDQLELPQLAMIAGLPKAPSRFNPVANPDRALTRRNYVLGRMRDLSFITPAEYETAVRAPISSMVHGLKADLEAPYVAEMARAYMEEKLGEEAYTGGYRLYTTLEPRFQMAATKALRQALLAYDRRHGFRGPELKLDPELELEAVEKAIADIPAFGGLKPAAVLSVDEQSISVLVKDTGEIEIPWSGLQWARRHLDENRLGPELTQAGEILSKGDVIRVELKEDGWTLAQIPKLEGAIVALDPNDGAVLALSGGFDFDRSKFNRVIQAERQPGSAFKPFVYSAAMENGFTPASMINDAPVVFDDPGIEAAWRPENYSGRFFGPTRIREALYKSRNLVSIRLVRAMGVTDTLAYLERFGFDPAGLPRNLSVALGSVTLTPLELARGFSVLANGGYLVEPYFVLQTQDSDGEVIEQAAPRRVCSECESMDQKVEQNEGAAVPVEASVTQVIAPDSAIEAAASEAESVELEEPEPEPAQRVISARNAWIMNSMMRDVIRRGTGRRALALGRKDLAGKTGTTNDQRDAWFSGFNPNIVATTWVGFDQLEPLGRGETGARAALPMWIEFMREALVDVPETILEQPQGLVTVRIDPDTGRLASAGDDDAIFEIFYSERAPESLAEAATPASGASSVQSQGVTEQLF